MHKHKTIPATDLKVGDEFDMFGSTAVVESILLNENNVIFLRCSVKQFNSTAYQMLHIPSHFFVQINT